MFDIQHILSILPHRYPLLMVDRILELKPDWIVGIKNVTVNEPFFQGHFPGLPVMPGVLIIESMAQVGAVLLLTNATENGENFDDKVVLFTSIDHAKFRKPVVPGDQLRIELKVLKHKGSIWKVSARALVEGKLAAEAVLMCHVAERSSLEGPDSPASRAPAKSGES